MASKSVRKEKAIATEGKDEDQVPKNKGKAYRGAPRGKPSWRAKDDKFRERVGGRVINENRQRIEQNCYAEIDIVLSQLSNLCLHAEPVTAQLPITTRAFGLLTSMAYRMAVTQMHQPPQLSMNAFYRLALAQLHLQMIKAAYEKKGQMSVDKIEAQEIVSPFFNFDSVVMSHPATLKALSTVIDTIGTVEFQTVKYFPVIPKSGVKVLSRGNEPAKKKQCTVPQEGSSAVMDVDDTAGTPRPTQIRAPDPFTVTFSNLREDVVYLANPDTSPYAREFFRRHNPLPGAIWNEHDVLVNPDDIMPNNYGVVDLRHEFLLLDAMTDRLKGKTSHLLASCSFSGRGAIGQLTTVQVDGRVYHDSAPFMTTEFCGSPFDIGDQQMLLGLLSMVREFPPYSDPNLNYGSCVSTICGKTLPGDWNAVVDTVIKRHA